MMYLIRIVLFAFGAAAALANTPPNTPDIVSPTTNGAIVSPSALHMESGPFSDPDVGDTHLCSDWEIWTITPSQRIWFGSCVTGGARTHAHFSDGAFENSHAGRTSLLFDTDYRLRLRYRDNSGNPASEWSAHAQRLFRTAAQSAVLPLVLQDAASSPAPLWQNSAGGNVILPGGATPPALRVESPAGELLLEFRASNGVTNLVFNPAALAHDKNARVKIGSGVTSGNLILPESRVTFTDGLGVDRTISLPALTLAPSSDAFFWVSANGSTYVGGAGQTAPDFSLLARGAPVPWTVKQPGYQVEVVATGFQMPIAIAFVPNPGTQTNSPLYYVAELYGNIKVVTRDGSVRDYAADLLNFNPTGVFPGSGERGLAGVLVEPSTGDVFATLVYDANPPNNGPFYPKVIRLQSSDGGLTAAGQTTVLDMAGESQGPGHQVSTMHIGPSDGKLYVHVGDGFNTAAAQNLDSFQGKILRMNLNGTAATDNPFYNAADGINARDYVYAHGMRNPFGGAWRGNDGELYQVENGPNVDRFGKAVAGRNFGWNGTDASMATFAIYNWNGPFAPVHLAFIQSQTFGGSGFPNNKFDRAYVTESGPTYASGVQAQGKRISEFALDGSGNLLSGPTPLIEYNGSGKATAAALTAGPDGLYFSDLYKDDSTAATNRGASILRVKFVGSAEFSMTIPKGPAPLTVQFKDKSNVPSSSAWFWDFGDGNTSTARDPAHIYTANGSYDVRLEVTGPNGSSVVQKNSLITVSSTQSEIGAGVAVFEAEDFVSNIARGAHSWALSNSVTTFSGTGYMEATPNSGANLNTIWVDTSPELQYTVDFTSSGTRHVWVRGYGKDGNDDSLHAGLGATLPSATNTAAAITWQDRWNAWVWTNRTMAGSIATISVGAPGEHTFRLWMREDGMRVDRVLLTTNTSNFLPQLGNAWHIPNNPEAIVGLSSMRIPVQGMLPTTPVAIFNGNQFQGAGNAADQAGSSTAVFFKRSTDAAWSSLPVGFHSQAGNNKYFSNSIPANAFSGGDVVQYYMRVGYTDRLPTFLYGNDGQSFATEFESVARANPFSYSVHWPLEPSGPYHSFTNTIGGVLHEARIYEKSGHIALVGPDLQGYPLANAINFAPPSVKIGGATRQVGAVTAVTPIVNGLQVVQQLGAGSITARLTFPHDGVMRYEVIDWGGQTPAETYVAAVSPGTERFYGFGEKFNTFDQSGRKVRIMALDPPGDKGDDAYKVAPWFVSTHGYGFHLDSSAESFFDMRNTSADRYVVSNLFSSLRFNVVYGPRLTDVLKRYTGYTGRPTLPPQWAFAPWMSSDHWRNGGEVRYVVTKYREHGLPGSAFVFDSPWEIAYNDFTWNMTQFGNDGTYEGQFYPGFASLADMMTFMRTNGWKVICWMTPFVNRNSFNEGVPGQNTGQAANYAEGALNNYFVKAGNPQTNLVARWWKGNGSTVDFTNPGARQWISSQLSNLVNVSKSGGFEVIGGFKTDDGEMGHPTGDVYIPTDAVYFDGRTGVEMRNGYSAEYHKTIWNILGTNGILFARSGFTGSHAYPGYWAGDNAPNFGQENGLQSAIVSGQGAAMSGYSIWGHDIGAYQNCCFSSTPTNLFVRWTQFGALSPLMQMHRQVDNPVASQYPWRYGTAALENYRFYTRLHTALFPYIYSYAKEASTNGLPIIRPLVLMHQEDANTHGLRHTYLFGNELLVAAIVTNNATSRNVYMPAGKWHDYFTGTTYIGSSNIVWNNANQQQMPLFVRDGAIIPMISSNVMTLVDAAYVANPNLLTMDNSLEFLVYPTTNSAFTVYDGTSLQVQSNATVISATLNAVPRPIQMRFYSAQPAGVERDGVKLPKFNTAAEFAAASLGWRYDAPSKFVHIKLNHAGGAAQIKFGPDSVGDGISDSWRQHFFGGPTPESCATCDPDGDGLTNAQEYQAGTHPFNPSNVLQIALVQKVGADFVVNFPSVVGIKYRVERTDDLTAPDWMTVQDNIAGTGGTIQIHDPGAALAPKRFYRVRILP